MENFNVIDNEVNLDRDIYEFGNSAQIFKKKIAVESRSMHTLENYEFEILYIMQKKW
jgi:hypothetical protein